MKQNVRLLLIDADDRRPELRRQFTGSQFAIVGESSFGAVAVTEARAVNPDIIIVSIEEPLVRAMRTIEILAQALPDVPVVAVSSVADPDGMRRTMRAGAKDYLIKRTKITLDLLLSDSSFEDRVKPVANNHVDADSKRLVDLSTELDFPVFWQLPWDTSAVDNSRLGRPTFVARPDTEFSAGITQLARAVSGLDAARSPQEWNWYHHRQLAQGQPLLAVSAPKSHYVVAG